GDTPGKRNGWHRLHQTPWPRGIFGSWKLGETHVWQQSFAKRPTKAEQQAYNETEKQQAAETEQKRTAACERAERLWSNIKQAPSSHPYMQKKHVLPHIARWYHGTLVIPALDITGKLRNLQLIATDGTKHFLRGGRVKGCLATIGEIRQRIYLAEGF